MPHVRISLLEGKSPEYLTTLSDTVQTALVETIGIDAGDRFQIIEPLPASRLIVSNPLVGVTHSDDIIVLYITLKMGRTVEIKRRLYQRLATMLTENLGVRQDDVIIMLVELPPENWSFGQGRATLID